MKSWTGIKILKELEEIGLQKQSQKKERSLIRPGDGTVAAFLVPVLVMVIIFIQREIFPFGEESFLRTDMYHQYAPFFSEFHYKLRHGGSLLYSWDVGMGINFAALYAYYLASPFNWLLLLCPKKLIIEFMTYLIVLKIGLCGLTMHYYLRKHYKTECFGTAYFGILYALSGYLAAYSWNIMWLDCIFLFPLILLGVERLAHEGKWKLYCICLGLSILSNYYISIMTCIFLVIYFVALLILERWQGFIRLLTRCGQFALASLGAGGLAGFILLPEVLALQSTASGSSTFPKTFSSYFSIIDMIARHIGNVEVEIGLDHWPNIYCGVAVLMFFLMYLACREISAKEKIVFCSLLLFFYLSFSVNVLNFLWHGFHYPNSLPCRQSFIYILLLLSVCFHAYLKLDEIPWKHVALAFWGAVAFVLVAEQTAEKGDFHFIVFYVAVLFLALYTGLLYLYYRGVNRNVLVLSALGLVSLEVAINTTVTSVTVTSRTSYVRDNEDVEILLEEAVPKDTFYRIEKMTRKTKNDGAWMNFPSVSLFSSVANADLSKLFKQLGCESSTNAYGIVGSTPLVNSLFAVRYGLYSGIPDAFPLITYIGESGDTYLYENAYTLPLGFMVPSDLENEAQLESGIPADVQNRLSELLGGGQVLSDAWGEVEGQTFRFTPERDGDYYIYVINKNVNEVTISKGEESKKYDHVNRGFFLELGWCLAGEEITATCTENEIMDVRAYRFEESALRDIYENLKDGGMTVTLWRDTAIEGTVSAENPGLFFTSIPYDQGWTVTVDGQEVEGRKVLEAFLGFDLPAGDHEIQFHYYPPGMKTGLLLSAVSLLCILFLVWKEKKQGNKGHIQKESRWMLQDGQEEGLEGKGGMEPLTKKGEYERYQEANTNMDWLDDDIDSEADWDSWMFDDMDSEETNEQSDKGENKL
ncbi:MAG: YfhO family protein [Lachnospiraceae bacterium]|jgi:uncharacterized membrane protein YfhO|nr:YfhO family protein [Lachnospiraceae bacterium]